MSGAERSRVAWVLNLDAEEELAAGRRYAPTDRLRAIVRAQRRALVGDLVRPGDLVLDEDSPAGCAAGFEGRAWSPTPRALGMLARAGAEVGPAPDARTLARVNARPFAAFVRAELGEQAFAKHVAGDLERVLALVARPAPSGWLVRRTFGAAGRGRMRLGAGAPSDHERRWLEAGLARGPLTLEPWVEVTTEFTRSGFVHADGRVRIAGPCFQRTTAEGAWVRTARAGADDVSAGDDLALEAATERAGRALADAGYHGPFGIDAFRYRADGRETLNPLSEINARYTMDWTLAMRAEVAAATPGT